ncbi:hypothetical protein [Acaryochloris marina]|uniref:Uncharacterized protein n=1 Tax=Acaryochloris marina (strain MBIC 11017) TaxID=329726 RepID=A8ZMI4_ACAM1|nr:hypothetical protein [Acaryochloris marina]ABW32395.1 hypothetical protein AM1_C0087 [Acaryochloris marina MBIC11017]
MQANESISINLFFPAFVAAILLIIFLLSRSVLQQQTITQELEENQSTISSITDQIQTLADARERWVETIQKAQENLVLMFLELEETKEKVGLLPYAEGDLPKLLEAAKEQLTKPIEHQNK